jgi:hypothetical protein
MTANIRLTWEHMERHGIDTDRVRVNRRGWVDPQQWVVDSKDLESKLYFGEYVTDDVDADAEGWETLTYKRGDHVNPSSRKQPEWYETPEEMLTYVANWMQNN